MARSPSLSLQKWDGCQHPQQSISRTGDTVDAGVFTELFGDAETNLSSGSDSPIFVPLLSTRIPLPDTLARERPKPITSVTYPGHPSRTMLTEGIGACKGGLRETVCLDIAIAALDREPSARRTDCDTGIIGHPLLVAGGRYFRDALAAHGAGARAGVPRNNAVRCRPAEGGSERWPDP